MVGFEDDPRNMLKLCVCVGSEAEGEVHPPGGVPSYAKGGTMEVQGPAVAVVVRIGVIYPEALENGLLIHRGYSVLHRGALIKADRWTVWC